MRKAPPKKLPRRPFEYGYYGKLISRGEMVNLFKSEGYRGSDVELALRVAESRARARGKNKITDMDVKNILDFELPKIRGSHPRMQ